MNDIPENCRPSVAAYTFSGKHLRKVALICALVVPVSVGIAFATSARINLPRVILYSIIYCYSIGGFCGLALPAAGRLLGRYKRITQLLALTVLIVPLTAAGCALAGLVLILLRLETTVAVQANFYAEVRFSIVIALVAGLGAYLYHLMLHDIETARIELRTRQYEEERAKKLAAEARLSSLESRIHPHFLFNTLNSIASLIHDEPRLAEDTVGRLAALLRFSLDANQRSLVPLEQEMKIVRDYLEIEKTRLGERLRYTIDISPDAMNAMVPPLAIESLVENSVKHVVANRREGGEIAVRAARGAGVCAIEVSDSGPGFELEAAPAGHGVDNLISRLQVLYDGRARIAVTRGGERSTVRLELPETV